MSITSELDEFYASEPVVIIRDELKFHHKLGMGERAYKWLRARENLTTFSEAMGITGMASAAMTSSVVAGTVFGGKGLLATIGLATAATPVGWVIGVGALAGGGYIGLSKLLERSKERGLVVVPRYINTPLDIIAATVIDLLLPIGLKFATLDGKVCEQESAVIRKHFVNDWGYSEDYVDGCLVKTMTVIDSVSITDLIEKLIDYAERNEDCDLLTIQNTLINFLQKLIESDGVIDDNELNHLKLVQSIFESASKKSVLREKLTLARTKFGETANATRSAVAGATKRVGDASVSVRNMRMKSAKKRGEESEIVDEPSATEPAERKKKMPKGLYTTAERVRNKFAKAKPEE